MRSDVLNGLPVSPPIWYSELMPFDTPVDTVNAATAGQRHYFPSRTARGMWPVIGIANGSVIGVTSLYYGYVYVTLCDVRGEALISEFPMNLFPVGVNLSGIGSPIAHARALQFDRLPISWENSYWQLSSPVVLASPDTLALWIHYAKPDAR